MKWTKELLKKCHNELGQAFGFLDAETREAMESVREVAPFDVARRGSRWERLLDEPALEQSTCYRINPSWLPDELRPRKLTYEAAFGPDSGAPEWARYAFMSKNGEAFYAEHMPKMDAATLASYECPQNHIDSQSILMPGLWDASDWRNSLVERKAVKPDDWREEYVRHDVYEDDGSLSIFRNGTYSLSECNSIPNAVFEWPDGTPSYWYNGPKIDSLYADTDPRKWNRVYPVAVWLPKGASK